ncbi:fused response regulator/phosphatase [Azospirillum canadense]|uniref:fused response regulator/phosphatase n=1 Tax=Azospirillum canadense TaxID=403962 RepID=UPI0022269D6E|nr:fused response regulator/phosphatase [Azospirillum canadense]MCW2237994.1 sigma-B regulation protein RsbU (phosphoserine phosphatase) [Azospirillum canadense]
MTGAAVAGSNAVEQEDRALEDRPATADCHILVVDDTDFNRTLIGALLTEAGFHDIAYAKDGFDALSQIAARTPDLVILDIMMPGMDGFEVCRRLRADHAYADLPVLVQTALSSSDDRNKAFAAGTTDLISKPLDRAELLARVRIHLENRVLIRDLQCYRARVEGELAMARSMHDHLLPSPALRAALKGSAGVDLRSHILLSSDMGGDLWGVLPLDAGRFGVFLLDMAGRGVSAALNAFRMHTLIHELAPTLGDRPDAFLAELNDRAVSLLELGEHATVIYGVVDSTAGRFTYAAAAATHPLVIPPGGAALLFGNATGLPVGITAGNRYDACTLPFPPGARLALYSNAVLDALSDEPVDDGNNDGNDGDDRPAFDRKVMAAVSVAGDDGDAFATLTAALAAALGETPPDDHTLVWIERGAAA